MSTKETEQRLIRIIAEHQIRSDAKKLLISNIAAEAGISRQSFNRYYSHLKPYVTRKKPIEELLADSETESATELLLKSQQRIRQLQDHIKGLKASHEKELRDLENSYITSLMNNDIALFDTDEVRVLLEKQSLHNEKLLNRIQELQSELMKEKAKTVISKTTIAENRGAMADVIVIDVDLNLIIDNYADTKDLDVFEDEKEVAIEKALKRINKLCESEESRLVIFVDRYISRFSSFVDTYRCRNNGIHIIIRLPIFTRTELKIFLGKLTHNRPTSIYIPYCDSKAVIKAQRNFLFRNIPSSELTQADMAFTPLISEGFEEVSWFRIKQGD
ncbi:MAG: hypothetical protein ACXV8J_02470 [Methylobacter sp.]